MHESILSLDEQLERESVSDRVKFRVVQAFPSIDNNEMRVNTLLLKNPTSWQKNGNHNYF